MPLVFGEFMPPVIGVVASCLVAIVLFWAAQSKVASFRDFINTVQATLGLNFSRGGATLIGAGVVLAEVTAVVACLSPGLHKVASILVAGLGVVFAGAGAVALIRRQQIACNCFGTRPGGKTRNLGWPHVALLPVWLVAAVLIAAPRPMVEPVAETTTLLALLALALVRAAWPAVRALRDLRHERLLFR